MASKKTNIGGKAQESEILRLATLMFEEIQEARLSGGDIIYGEKEPMLFSELNTKERDIMVVAAREVYDSLRVGHVEGFSDPQVVVRQDEIVEKN